MSSKISPQSIATLRAISYRTSSTPTKQLPLIAGQIAGSLWSCKDILSASADSSKANSEIATVVHRFKTSLSSLLQDRTIEGRWAAVVLLKATIEAGGIEVLSKSNAWVRYLLSILKKPDPPTTRNLTVITLTRIFILTWDYSNVVREITTPALPGFLSTCLSNLEKERCSASELQTVLGAFSTLVPRHPTIFRTHEAQIRSLLLKTLSHTSSAADSNFHYTESHKACAQHLFVLLHHCAPKQGGSEKWDETFKATIAAAHTTCDRLFRSVVEDWRSTADVQKDLSASIVSPSEAELEGEDALGLRGWKGVYAGRERLLILLGTLRSHLQTATGGNVPVRIGLVVDLLARVFSLTVPAGAEAAKINNKISKDEREALFAVLPATHAAALELLDAMLARFGDASASFAQGLLELIIDVHRAEKSDPEVRIVAYKSVRNILELVGPSMLKEDITELAPIMRGCCEDLLPTEDEWKTATGGIANGMLRKPQASNIDLAPQTTKASGSHPTSNPGLDTAARALLTSLFTDINPPHMPRKLRVQMERTAVLTRHKDALIACVMNPAKKDVRGLLQTSLLPLLARDFPDSPEVEALLRPRMPPITTNALNLSEVEVDGYGSEEGEDVVNGATPDDTDRADEENDDLTSGLLNALGQNDSTAVTDQEPEDLYSATPRTTDTEAEVSTSLPASSGREDQLSGIKRMASGEPTDSETSAKRLRASPVAEALANDVVPGPDPATAQTALPTTVVVSTDQTQSGAGHDGTIVTTQPAPPFVPDNSYAEGDVGSDDSDFEMPPLTLESDTDPEDEEEDEE
ncbi:hypothetical protein LTR37_021396 [Vermiconidia calcicola]|uniref:Uncharacterized protein n=1 Tax=Vermiconidia calcicola TaxID=1690605 RepID=A0ACC3M8R9_9PEZI|nr:hypothetical protein LTR37_021396 [Vermiconidia calcicola]